MQSTKEIWRPILGPYLGLYEASNLGRIRAARDIIYENGSRYGKKGDLAYRQHQIIYYNTTKGHATINLYVPKSLRGPKFRACEYVYRLVYCAFHGISISDIPRSTQLNVDHIDNDPTNNRIDNLQLLTVSQNGQKSYDNDENHRWSNRKPGVIRIEDNKIFSSLKEACAKTCIGDSRIIAACKEGTTAGGYHWRYLNEEKHQQCLKNRRKRSSSHHVRPNTNLGNLVRCIETGQIEKASVMARQLKCSSSEVIYNAIDYNHGYSKFLDLHFELV